MKTIETIIELRGGLDHLKTHPITLVNPGFMDLCIEYVGTGPRGCPLISVAMYYEQNGDLMRDPDLVLEFFPPTKKWMPVSFRNDGLGIDQVAVWRDGDALVQKGGLVADLEAFAEQWSIDLKVQGFLTEARRQAGK
jgi:uncharacterized protein DUF6908